MTFVTHLLSYLRWANPSKPVDDEFVTLGVADTSTLCIPRSVSLLQSLAKEIGGLTCKREITLLAATIEHLRIDILTAQVNVYLIPLMDYIHCSDEPPIIGMGKRLKKEEGFQELREIYTKAIQDDQEFVPLGKASREALFETLYPVKHLRLLADRVSEVSSDGDLRKMAQRVAQIPDGQLDVEFVGLHTPLMSQLFFSKDPALLDLRWKLKDSFPECSSFFEKLAEITYRYNREGRAIERINENRYLAALEQMKALKQEIEQMVSEITSDWEDYKKEEDPEEQKEILTDLLENANTLNLKERQLRLLEAHVHIFTKFLENRGAALEDRKQTGNWVVVGGAIAFLAMSVFSSYLGLPFLLPNSLINDGTAMDGLSAAFLALFPGGALGLLLKWMDNKVRPKLLTHRSSRTPVISLTDPTFNSTGHSITYRFNSLSTSPVRALVGLPSRRVGRLILAREGEKSELPFTKIQDTLRLDQAALYEIRARLLVALQLRKLQPQECLNFLQMLVSARFITAKEREVFFSPVLRRCQFETIRSSDEWPLPETDEDEEGEEELDNPPPVPPI